MKRIILVLLALVFLNTNLYTQVLTGTLENENPKILDELFEKVRVKYNLDRYSNGLDKYINVDAKTYVNTNGYTHTFKIFKPEEKKIFALFRVNIIYNKDNDAVKQLGFKRGTFGVIIINELPTPTKKRKAFIYLGHERELGMEVCLAPYKENDFEINNPTCKNKWDMYFYKKLGKRTLNHERIMLNKELTAIDKELELKLFMLDVLDTAVSPVSKVLKGGISKAIEESLSAIMPINLNDGKVNKTMGDIYANWIVTVIEGGVLGVVDVAFEANKIIENLLATADVLDVDITRNNISIAEKYLDLYYKFGSSQRQVLNSLILNNYSKPKELVYSRLNNNSTLDDILTQIAIDLGHYQEYRFSDNLGSGKFAGVKRDYDPRFTISIIKNIIEKLVPPLSSQNLDSPDLQIYTEYEVEL